jgi:hypothetical protein
MESLMNHLIDIFPDAPTLEGYSFVAPLNLELYEQMKMTELKDPSFVLGNALHALKIVDYECADSSTWFLRDGGEDFSPSIGSLFARKEHGIQKDRYLASTRFEGCEIQDPGLVLKMKPKPIGQQSQRTGRNLSGTRAGEKSIESLTKSVTKIQQT